MSSSITNLSIASLSIASSVRTENTHSGSFAMAESSFENAHPQERTQKEENSRAMLPTIVENAAERSGIPDIEEKKNSSDKTRKNAGSSEKKKKKSALSEKRKRKAALSEKTGKQAWNKLPSSFGCLDFWNLRFPEVKQGTEEENRRGLMLGFKPFDIDARQLREKEPHRIPVSVEKDAGSDIPDIGMKKYHVDVNTPLGEFVYLIRWQIRLSTKKPIFVFFKNTKPPMDALMSAIDEENKDEDGFLHVTYSGEEKNVNENSRSGSFAFAESSFKQESSLERAEAEVNTPDPVPMIVESAAASSDIPDVEEKKSNALSGYSKMMVKKAATAGPGTLVNYGWSMKRLKNIEHRRACGIDAWQLREKQPDYIPVTVEKDAKSDIPEVDMKIHHVHGDAPLEYFVHFMEGEVRRDWTRKPVFVFFKNTKPTMDALMSAIYEDNKDEDGFLHVTYSGRERDCGSNDDQQEWS